MIEDRSNMNLSNFIIAEVRNNIDPDNEGKIAVFIPELMYDNEYNEEPYEEDFEVELDQELILNAKDFQESKLELQESNYIWARPLTYHEDNNPNWKEGEKHYSAGSVRVPRIGSQVIVIFLNSDLQKCYYFPFTPSTAENSKIDSFNCINPENFENSEKRINVDVIRFYWDGTRIEVDTNTHEIMLATPKQNYIKLSDEKIEIKGDILIKGKLEVEEDVHFRKNVDIDNLLTCNSKLDVQGTGYFSSGIKVNGSITYKGSNIEGWW